MSSDKTASGQPQDLCAALGLITESELFALLGISPGTGKNRQSAGRLPPHYKGGRRKFYKLAEVDAWLKRHRVSKAAA
jgi:hypothetical protein